MTNTSALKITEENNTIVDDFQIFLHYFNKKAKLTKRNAHITRKDLITLNEKMTKLKIGMPATANQSAYPHMHLFYHLAFELDLLQSMGQTVMLNKECADEFMDMTRSEKYVSLLNCFWTLVSWRALNDNRPPV